jgi:hypothetical protein
MVEELESRDTPTQQVASPRTINAAAVGTTPVVGAGVLGPITVAQWTNTATDLNTPMTLLDSNGPPAAGVAPKVLFSANLLALACLFEPRPAVPLTPSLTAPTWPKTIYPALPTIPFANGLYVASCPANTTFTATA